MKLESIDNEKDRFLLNEFWLLSISGAFSRNRIYKPETKDDLKNQLKNDLREMIDSLVKDYKKTVSEENHYQNIQRLSEEISSKYSEILNLGVFNIGTTQKLLNLYLKYLWTIDKVEKPPHFPVDRIMISEVLKMKGNLSWTKFSCIEEYKKVIDFAKEKCLENNETLADFEVREFSRRNY